MIWDTHAHLDDERFQKDFNDVLQRMDQVGITRVLNAGYDVPSSGRSVKLAEKYDFIYAAVGIHPHDAADISNDSWDTLLKLAAHSKVLAWGEIGLDYYRDLSPRPIQKEVFIQQIKLAEQAELPIIIHNRDAHEDTLAIVKEHPPKHGGVFHCYAGSWEMAKVILNLGFYISFAGPLTYKNSRIAVEVASKVPLDRFVVETDSPYLTPEPYRGKRNEPAHVRAVLAKFAEIRNLSFEEAAQHAMQNSKRLFRIED